MLSLPVALAVVCVVGAFMFIFSVLTRLIFRLALTVLFVVVLYFLFKAGTQEMIMAPGSEIISNFSII